MTAEATALERARAELHRMLADRSFRFGDFVLSSGRRSDYYFDGKQVTLDGRGLRLVGELVLARCRELGATAVGGLTLGADPIAAAAATLSAGGGEPLRAFIVRAERKQHGTARRIEGPPLGAGDRVVLVDDVATTGGALATAAGCVRETGAAVMEAIVVVDREEGGAEALSAIGVTLAPLFRRSDFAAPRPPAS